MSNSDVIKLCKSINTNKHYIDHISNGVRCCCYSDVHGNLRLQVIHFDKHAWIMSDFRKDWDIVDATCWILDSTYELRGQLGI